MDRPYQVLSCLSCIDHRVYQVLPILPRRTERRGANCGYRCRKGYVNGGAPRSHGEEAPRSVLRRPHGLTNGLGPNCRKKRRAASRGPLTKVYSGMDMPKTAQRSSRASRICCTRISHSLVPLSSSSSRIRPTPRPRCRPACLVPLEVWSEAHPRPLLLSHVLLSDQRLVGTIQAEFPRYQAE